MFNKSIKLRQLLISLAMTLPYAVQAGQITVITSFPKELTSAYKTAFQKKYPDIQLEILNKSTTASIAYIRETPSGQRPEIFWASAPDAFEVLTRESLLTKLSTDVGNPNASDKIGTYPLNDPEGFYKGQALSGYGIMWNKRYMQANKLPSPAEWSDLTKASYFGHVAMSAPSRSGTTHLTVETILQGEGWKKGWAELLQIAGNCAAITERSFGVPDGINNGQFGMGLVIDFFGLAGKYSGFPVEFVYPKMTAVVPANIGIVNGGKNIADAKTFVNFALSQEGQEILLKPEISRLPVVSYSSLGNKVPKGYPNVSELVKDSKVKFDTNLSESRYPVVTTLFDQSITFRLKELQAATKAIHEAEKKVEGRSNTKAQALIKQARDLAFLPLIDESTMKDERFLNLFKKDKKDAAVSMQLAKLEEEWSTKAKQNYLKAAELATEATSLIK